MLQLVVDDIHLAQTTKDPGHTFAVRIIVTVFFLLTQGPRLLVRLLGRLDVALFERWVQPLEASQSAGRRIVMEATRVMSPRRWR